MIFKVPTKIKPSVCGGYLKASIDPKVVFIPDTQ